MDSGGAAVSTLRFDADPNIPSRSPCHRRPRAARKFPNTRLPVRGGYAQFASSRNSRTTTPVALFHLQEACAECPVLEVLQPGRVRAHSPTYSALVAHTKSNAFEGPPEGNRHHSSPLHSNSPWDETHNAAIPRPVAQSPRAHRTCSNLRPISEPGNPHTGESCSPVPTPPLSNTHATTVFHSAHKIWGGGSFALLP